MVERAEHSVTNERKESYEKETIGNRDSGGYRHLPGLQFVGNVPAAGVLNMHEFDFVHEVRKPYAELFNLHGMQVEHGLYFM